MSLLFALVGIACLLLRRASAHWRYLLWLVVLIKCLVPPLVLVTLPGTSNLPFNQLSQSLAVQSARRAVDQTEFATPASNENKPAPSPSRLSHSASPSIWERIDWSRLLVITWAAAALGYLITASIKAWRIQLGLAQQRTWPDMELECEFLELAKTVAVKDRPKLCLIRGLSQPFVWGILRGSIYLPENFARQGSAHERKLVMGHELAHVLRWDALVNLIEVLVQAIFIFHPLVWWLNRLIRHEREKCCDEAAIASLRVAPEEYGSAIVNRLADYFEPACPSSSLAISGRAKDLEDRITSLLRTGRSFYRQPTFLARVAVVLIALLVLPAQLATKARSVDAAVARTSALGAVTMLNLTPLTNASLGESWLPATTDDDLAGLGTGRHVLGDVPFQIDGIVQLSGTRRDEAARFPASVKDVKVERSFRKLHLLHACAGKETDGVTIARIIVHYEDGQQRELPIAYGSQVRDWQFWDFEPVSDKNTAMAWTGENLYVRTQNGSLRLYRTTWANPRPLAAVASIDYVSSQSGSAPFMVGLTVE